MPISLICPQMNQQLKQRLQLLQQQLKHRKRKPPIGFVAQMATGGITIRPPMSGGTNIHKETS